MAKEYDKNLFVFVQEEDKIKDQKFDTKPVGFFKDCLGRFKKNKSSVVAFYIIILLFLFAFIAPLTTNYGVKPVANEGYYQKMLPISRNLQWLGWDGTKNREVTKAQYDLLSGLGAESTKAHSAFTTEVQNNGDKYSGKVSSYYEVGYIYLTVSKDDYQSIIQYQNEHNVQILYPILATHNLDIYTGNSGANYWYKLADDPYKDNVLFSYNTQIEIIKMNFDPDGTKTPAQITVLKNQATAQMDTLLKKVLATTGEAARDENGNYVPNYLYSTSDTYTGTKVDTDNPVVIEGTTYYAQYYTPSGKNDYKIRVCYYDYYIYKYGQEPIFLFGTDQFCCDIFTCLGCGARLSFILAIGVSIINLIIGFIYGSIEGYYGGATDLIMERISDILASVPFIVVATLFQMHLADQVGTFTSLLFAFVLTGWIGIASTVRHQFYRFKNQEYILAARTLGASDFRLIFKHIFPNAMGTIITSCVLIIPGVIFSESILSYLGIVSFKTSDTLTSIGTMLSNGEAYLSTYPHIILFPTIFISLLEISFNLFGNGLRDAFNPSLRGSED